MKKIITTIFLFASLYAAGQESSSWYKMLTGNIDKYAITMHLHKQGHSYSGYYYYNSRQSPVYVMGEDTSEKGKIKLAAYADPNEPEYFTFSFSGNAASGTWRKDKTLSLSLTEAHMPVAFTNVYTEGSVKLRPAVEDSPDATFEAASVWPPGNTTTDEFIKSEIRKLFFQKDEGGEIGALLLKMKKKFFADYLEENKDVTNAELKDSYTAYSMDVSDKLMIMFQTSNLVTLAFDNYAYTGGAHGNYGTEFKVLDLTKNRSLTLPDILTESGIAKLQPKLEASFRKQFNLQPGDSLTDAGLFENKIEANDNICVTGSGLQFVYNPYEIGPYAMGEIELFIPFTELTEYLKPGFKNLLNQ